jgi:hypothetical protein
LIRLWCDPDATTWKLDGSPKDSRAKPLCELTPIKQLMLLPSTQSGPNPWTVPIPKMPCLTKWKQDTDLALLGVQRECIYKIQTSAQSKCIKSCSGFGGAGAVLGMSGLPWGWGRRNINNEQKGIKKVPPPNLNHRPRQILFWTKRGAPSVIGFPNYFLRGEFCHVRTQQTAKEESDWLLLWLDILIGILLILFIIYY